MSQEHSKDDLLLFAMFGVDNSHDFFGLDIVFEVDFEGEEPKTEFFSSDF